MQAQDKDLQKEGGDRQMQEFATSYLQVHDPTPSFWKDVPAQKPDPVFGLIHGFLDDKNPRKVLLGVGAYRDNDGKPKILDVVKKAEQRVVAKQTEKEYSFPDGIPSFRARAMDLAYGADHPAVQEGRVCSMQTVSGTGALKMGFQLMRMHMPATVKKAYTTNVRWSLHNEIVPRAGFELNFIRYYDPVTKGLDIEGFIEDLDSIEDDSLVLLQTSCQNPSGVDPTKEEWCRAFEVIKKKRHFIFFDSAYLGFASDDLSEDMFSLRTLAASYYRVMLSQSFSKNFGLYGERCGTLSIVVSSKEECTRMQTNLKALCLPEYSCPPIHGAKIVDEILGDEALTKEWKTELSMMSERLRVCRRQFVDKLKEHGSKHDWSHILNQVGMFAYTGLKPEMVARIKSEFSVYMPFDGRISIAGLNDQNVDHVAAAFHAVTDGLEI